MAHDPMLCNIPCLLFDIVIDEKYALYFLLEDPTSSLRKTKKKLSLRVMHATLRCMMSCIV